MRPIVDNPHNLERPKMYTVTAQPNIHTDVTKNRNKIIWKKRRATWLVFVVLNCNFNPKMFVNVIANALVSKLAIVVYAKFGLGQPLVIELCVSCWWAWVSCWSIYGLNCATVSVNSNNKDDVKLTPTVLNFNVWLVFSIRLSTKSMVLFPLFLLRLNLLVYEIWIYWDCTFRPATPSCLNMLVHLVT